MKTRLAFLSHALPVLAALLLASTAFAGIPNNPPPTTPDPEPTSQPTSSSAAGAAAGALAGAAAGAYNGGNNVQTGATTATGTGGDAQQGQQQGIAESGNGTGVGIGTGGAGGQGGNAQGGAGGSAAGGNAAGGHAAAGASSDQGQEQGQGQQQGQTSSLANDASSSVQVDAADRSSTTTTNIANSTYRGAQYIATQTQPSLPVALASGDTSVVIGGCGPSYDVVSERVTGVFFGLFKRVQMDQGVTERLVPSRVPFRTETLPDGTVLVFGKQVTTYVTKIGLASNRGVQLGGGSSAGGHGQAGLGSASANEQLVKRHDLQDCLLYSSAVPAPALPVVEQVRG